MVNNMCLLTLVPPTVTLDYDRAKRAALSNPDGFGFAIHAGTAIIKDHDMDFEKLWVRWSELTKIYNNNASLFHWRISTHGTTSVDNCHPFDVGDNNRVVLGHNGMLPITMPINDNRSDTKLFAQFVLPSLAGGIAALDNPSVFKNIEDWAIGSKLVVLSADPKTEFDWYILNEKAGHWAHDMWWSNSSYKPFTYTNYTGYGYTSKSYTSPYLGWDNDRYEAYDDALNDEDDQPMSGWTIHDSEQYIMEELYQDDIIETILSFTDYTDADFAKVTCKNCTSVYYVDALDASATHCGECTACLACGKPGCNCWDDYEYGQSFLNWDAIKGEVNVETQIKS